MRGSRGSKRSLSRRSPVLTGAARLRAELKDRANPDKAAVLSRFFKTGRGEYGEGDVFLGIQVPELRKIAKQYPGLSISVIGSLLSSRIHEERMLALLLLMNRYRKADPGEKREIVEFYLANTRHINNWDLVDLSAGHILGDYLLDRDRSILSRLVKSADLWERRIAILATFPFIRRNQYRDTLRLAELLLNDSHELIHKAVGWMLREIGKRDLAAEEEFLQKHYRTMPRTMLRYAIERFEEEKRRRYLGMQRKPSGA